MNRVPGTSELVHRAQPEHHLRLLIEAVSGFEDALLDEVRDELSGRRQEKSVASE